MKRQHLKKFVFCLTCCFLSLSMITSQPVRAQVFSVQISRELEFVESILEKAIAEGDSEKLLEAHLVLSNLSVTIQELADIKKRTMFTLALGYEYVEMCPSVVFNQLGAPGNPSGFTIDCAKQSLAYFEMAVELARGKLDMTSIADTLFLAGIGADRLKYKMSDVPGANTTDHFKTAREYIRKAAEIGPAFEGIETILKRFEKSEYLENPVVDDARFKKLKRILVLDDAYPSQPETAGKPVLQQNTPAAAPAYADQDGYVDYRWRFSVSRPDDSWKFVADKTDVSLHLVVQERNIVDQKGSGLSIVCTTMNPVDAAMPLKQLVEKSVTLLEQAGYTVGNNKRNFEFAGLPAYEIISEHRYNDSLIPSGTMQENIQGGADSSNTLISKQYMIIIVANSIQYIISFSSFDKDYAEISKLYLGIANTINFY